MAEWISHRGLREGLTVENSAKAFADAVRKGFCVLETDLRLTADHHLVLSHDPTFERLSGDAKPIINLTRSQVERIRYADGQRPFFFDEFAANHGNQKWVLDVKPETSAAALRTLLKTVPSIVSHREFCAKTAFVVWRSEDKAYVKEYFSGAAVYATERDCWRAGLSILYGKGVLSGIQEGVVYSLPPRLWGRSLYTKSIAGRYHERGARLLAFLPGNEQEFTAAMESGFDEVLSDGWLPPPTARK